MQLRNRDLHILDFVGRFGQVTAEQIRRTQFSENKSRTPAMRAIARLLNQKLLARIERRTVGGARGGSGQYVYQLGAAGWKAASVEGAYWQARSVNYHSLAIAEVYASIHEMTNDRLELTRYETEPDSHVKINYIPLNPDLYVELLIDGSIKRHIWFEVDLATERPRQLKEKMSRYHRAWAGADAKWDPWPYVVWVVPDARRRRELEALVALQPKESQPMYWALLLEDVPEVLRV